MNQIEIYQSTDEKAQVEVRFEEESVWLTQKQLAIKNTYCETELNKK